MLYNVYKAKETAFGYVLADKPSVVLADNAAVAACAVVRSEFGREITSEHDNAGSGTLVEVYYEINIGTRAPNWKKSTQTFYVELKG